jgi:hypothetical protein
MKEITERIYPLLVAGFFSAIYFIFGAGYQIPEKISDVFAQAITAPRYFKWVARN